MKIGLQGYSVKPLTLKDADALQNLYERCADYFNLTGGEPPVPTAAKDEFSAVPESKDLDDKFMFGLFRDEVLTGLLESVRHYPDEKTWWIGLLLLEPGTRGQGVGAAFYSTFEANVASQEIARVMLSVVEENTSAFRFWRRLGFDEVRRTAPRTFGDKMHVLSVMRKDMSD